MSVPSKPWTNDGLPYLTKTNSIAWAQALSVYFKKDTRRLTIVNTEVTPQLVSVTPAPVQLPQWVLDMPADAGKDQAIAHFTNLQAVTVRGHLVDVFDLSHVHKFKYVNAQGNSVMESSTVHTTRMELWQSVVTSLLYRQDILNGIVTFDVRAIWLKVKRSVTAISEINLLAQENRFLERKFGNGRKDFKTWMDSTFNEFQDLVQKGSDITDVKYINTIMLAIKFNPSFVAFLVKHEGSAASLSIQEFDAVISGYALEQEIHLGSEERSNLSDSYKIQKRPTKPFHLRTPAEMAELKLVPCNAFAKGNCPWGENCHRNHDSSAATTPDNTAHHAPKNHGKKDWKSKITCNKCGKKGHFANECKGTGEEEKPEKPDEGSSHSLVSNSENTSSTGFYYVSFLSVAKPSAKTKVKKSFIAVPPCAKAQSGWHDVPALIGTGSRIGLGSSTSMYILASLLFVLAIAVIRWYDGRALNSLPVANSQITTTDTSCMPYVSTPSFASSGFVSQFPTILDSGANCHNFTEGTPYVENSSKEVEMTLGGVNSTAPSRSPKLDHRTSTMRKEKRRFASTTVWWYQNSRLT
jgi:hypothetical protein